MAPVPRRGHSSQPLGGLEIDVQALREVFAAETHERLEGMELALVQLESSPGDPEMLAGIFRAVHTLKGDASSVGLDALRDFAHEIEDQLERVREGQARVGSDLVTLLLRAVDVLRALATAEPGAPPPTQAAALLGEIERTLADGPARRERREAGPSQLASAGVREAARAGRTLRVGVAKLDRMLDLTGEIAIARGRLEQLMASVPKELAEPLLEVQHEVDTLAMDLQELVMRARMVPVGPTLRQFARSVRDLSASHGKQVRLVLEGEDVEVDNAVVEQLRDPLTHMVRNAIDHGIEFPETRLASGKLPVGRLVLRAFHHAGCLVIQVEDDGAGLDRGRIVERARERGLAPHPEQLGDAELLQLLFVSGFSTAHEITDLSGRGVGLDVVRRNVEALRGSVGIESRPGLGTTLTARVPLTLAIIQGFGVGVGGERFVVPVDVITECLEVPASERRRGATGTITLRDEPLPYVRLRERLGLPGPRPAREHVVVVRHEGGLAGLVVDTLQGESQTVVKPLGPPLGSLSAIAGSAILGSGRVALILDVPGLLDGLERPLGAITDVA